MQNTEEKGRRSCSRNKLQLSLPMFPFPASPGNGESIDPSLCFTSPALFCVPKVVSFWGISQNSSFETDCGHFCFYSSSRIGSVTCFCLPDPPHLLLHPPVFISFCWRSSCIPRGGRCPSLPESLCSDRQAESPAFMALFLLCWGCQLVEEAMTGLKK